MDAQWGAILCVLLWASGLVQADDVEGVQGADGGRYAESIAIPDSTYVAWKFHVDGPGSAEIRAGGTPTTATTLNYWSWRHKEGDQVPDNHLGGILIMNSVNAHAHTSALAPRLLLKENVFCDLFQPVNEALGEPCFFGSVTTWPLTSAGNWTVLFMSGIDGAWNGTLQMEATGPGLVLLGRTQGPAFLHRDQDFEGTLNIGTVEGPYGATSRVMIDTKVGLAVQHHLFGTFRGFQGVGDLAMGYDNLATGETRDGEPYYAWHKAEPGDYRFRVDEAYCAGTYLTPCFVYAFVADVNLP